MGMFNHGWTVPWVSLFRGLRLFRGLLLSASPTAVVLPPFRGLRLSAPPTAVILPPLRGFN